MPRSERRRTHTPSQQRNEGDRDWLPTINMTMKVMPFNRDIPGAKLASSGSVMVRTQCPIGGFVSNRNRDNDWVCTLGGYAYNTVFFECGLDTEEHERFRESILEELGEAWTVFSIEPFGIGNLAKLNRYMGKNKEGQMVEKQSLNINFKNCHVTINGVVYTLTQDGAPAGEHRQHTNPRSRQERSEYSTNRSSLREQQRAGVPPREPRNRPVNDNPFADEGDEDDFAF